MEIILKLVGIIIIAVGVVGIYDARRLTNRFFSTCDTNSATKTFKIIGFIVVIVGSVLVII